MPRDFPTPIVFEIDFSHGLPHSRQVAHAFDAQSTLLGELVTIRPHRLDDREILVLMNVLPQHRMKPAWGSGRAEKWSRVVLACFGVAWLLGACQGPPRGLAPVPELHGAWLLESVCEAETPAPEGCTGAGVPVRAAFDVGRGTVEFTNGLPSGRYRLTSERSPSGVVVNYLTLSGSAPAAQLEIRADTLIISWQYVDGAAYRFLRERR